MMKTGILTWALGIALAVSLSAYATAAPKRGAADYAAAVADPARPEADRARDGDRKPAEMLAFAKITPGDRVADFLPGAGYFTRLFSAAVGPKGTVAAVVPTLAAQDPARLAPLNALAADPHYGNVRVLPKDLTRLDLPEPLDVAWISQNYHDLYSPRLNLDIADFNRAMFAALKPGGLFIVLDHAAKDGSGRSVFSTLHRADQATVRAEVEAAGFVFDGESQVLRNPKDDRSLPVFDPAIRGHSDQFLMRFRKPG